MDNINKRLKNNHISEIIYVSIFIIIAAQLNINLFYVPNFRISLGIVFFTIIMVLLKEIPVIPVTVLSAFGVFILRSVYNWLSYGVFHDALINYMPETIGYLIYGIMVSFYLKRINFHLKSNISYVPLFLIDYISNFAELLWRIGINCFSSKAQASILLVAFGRTALIWAIISAIGYYGYTIMEKEQAKRYKKLILLISSLRGEVVWMKKNTSQIEITMNTAYKLFENMKKNQIDSRLTEDTLNVAKDIHEIKKEYVLIMRGITQALDLKLNEDSMYLHEILQIISESLIIDGKQRNLKVNFDLHYDKSIYTTKQYLLMSVFRNLFMNAMEASMGNEVFIELIQDIVDDKYRFIVKDHGTGIKDKDIGSIFIPGYSTKINYSTGEINRGLGLNLVKDIIENEFNGTIHAECDETTRFIINIPVKELCNG